MCCLAAFSSVWYASQAVVHHVRLSEVLPFNIYQCLKNKQTNKQTKTLCIRNVLTITPGSALTLPSLQSQLSPCHHSRVSSHLAITPGSALTLPSLQGQLSPCHHSRVSSHLAITPGSALTLPSLQGQLSPCHHSRVSSHLAY